MLYRKLMPSESAAYCRHLLRLDPEDRYARFFGQCTDAAIREHCRAIDWRCAALIGGYDRGILRAAAELRGRLRRWSDFGRPLVEAAISVEAPFQGHGVGQALLNRALLVARNRAARQVVLIALGDNLRMRRLAGRVMDSLSLEDGCLVATADPGWPTRATLARELVEDGLGLAESLLALTAGAVAAEEGEGEGKGEGAVP